ncbi:MAG TPA: hypothetical protein VHE33_17670 [Acidobacteriaceae bacterium]|nr:hypothetical protein [Acidobacteriaceae bacterium]
MAANSLLIRCRRLLAHPRMRWVHDPQLWVELFATANLGILAADIYIAHSVNQFGVKAEYVPLYFSIAAAALLAVAIALAWLAGMRRTWSITGTIVGWTAILTGLAGVLYHLDCRFFAERTLQSITYAAPFAAPLSYTGLGFLLLLNRSVAPRTAEWARWVIFLALGGFFGNFVLSLTDHAENGFFLHTEWIPVLSSALAVGFLAVPLLARVTRRYLDWCMLVMFAQALVGVLGFWFHLRANLVEPGHSLFDKLVNGAPPMAPLLFPNLVALAWIGLWALIPHVPEDSTGHSWLGATWLWAHPDQPAGD